jgi:hypothetical protein
VRCNASNHFFVERFSFTITYVDLDIAGKRVGENNTQLLSGHWPGDDESILPIVTSIVDTTILSIMNTAIAALSDSSLKIQVLWGCREVPNGDGGLYTHNVTPIFNYNTAARWVQAVMQLSNPTVFCGVYRGQQAEGTDGALMPICGGRSYLCLDDILPPTAEHMFDDIVEESDNDGEMRSPNSRSFLQTIQASKSLNSSFK